MPEVEEGDYLRYMMNGEIVDLEVAYKPLFFHSPGKIRLRQLLPLPIVWTYLAHKNIACCDLPEFKINGLATANFQWG